MQTGVIIPAAGAGTRYPGPERKQFKELAGQPLIVHTLERVLESGPFMEVVVAVPSTETLAVRKLLAPLVPAESNLVMVTGGATRQDSVAAGLDVLDERVQFVVVHDAVRPLFQPSWITDCIARCSDYDGAIVAIRATDTLKKGALDAGGQPLVAGTIPRETVWQAQTPQAFRADILRTAFRQAAEKGLAGTDEAALVEAANGRIAIVEGSPGNIKITSPADWDYLEWRLDRD